MKQRILIVEDDISFGTMLKGWFIKNDYSAELRTKVSDATEMLSDEKFDLILSDLRLPDGDGTEILRWMKDNNKNMPFIVMTSYGEVQSAVEAIKLGAEDYLQKPINPAILREKIGLVLDRNNKTEHKQEAKSENIAKTTEKKTDKSENKKANITSGFVLGKSEAAQQMFSYICKVAPTKMSVLILGESGTGKEYAARLIHDNSNRKDKPFIAVDCGSLSKELAPSELFGHLKGSFTSAIENKTGVFEQANGGTVFLDEVGNLSYDVQVQLLRALQEKKIRPVGSAKDVSVDVRIVSATNEDLTKAITTGAFREDLYHRLNEFSVQIPPLRERGNDIVMFAEEFLRQANEELEKDIKGFSPDAIKSLKSNSWSGNLRELRNVIRRSALFAEKEFITSDDLPDFIPAKEEELTLRPENEKEIIENAIKKAGGNKTLAAKMLKIDRKTLYNKIDRYDIKS